MKATHLSEVHDAIQAIRRKLTHSFASIYCKDVIERAFALSDLHYAGYDLECHERKSPLDDALVEIRMAAMTGEDHLRQFDYQCQIDLFLLENCLLLRVTQAREEYYRSLSQLPFLEEYAYRSGAMRPNSISKEKWQERESNWLAALSKPPLARGLRLTLIENALPRIPLAMARKYLPKPETRRRNLLTEIYLQNRLGRHTLLGERERALALTDLSANQKSVLEGIARSRPRFRKRALVKNLTDYRLPAKPEMPAPEMASAGQGQVAMAEHADVIETADGRTFMVILNAGLSREDRVFLQIGDRHVTITQNSVQFGHIENVPSHILDAIRVKKDLILVQIYLDGNKKGVLSDHVAIITDISLSDTYQQAIFRWSSSQKQKPASLDDWLASN